MKNLTLIISLSIALMACSIQSPTPNTQILDHQRVSVLKKDQKAISASSGAAGALFGPGMTQGSLDFNYSPQAKVENKFSAGLMDFGFNEQQHQRQAIFANFNQKRELIQGVANYNYGIGLGYHPYATWTDIASGITLGFENRYLIPSLSAQIGLNVPITREWFYLEDQGTGGMYRSAATAFHLIGLGLEIPFFQPNQGFYLAGDYSLGQFKILEKYSQDSKESEVTLLIKVNVELGYHF